MVKNLDVMKPRYSKDILPVPCPSLYQGSSVFFLVFIHSSFTYQLLLVHRVTLYIFLKSFHCITISWVKNVVRYTTDVVI